MIYRCISCLTKVDRPVSYMPWTFHHWKPNRICGGYNFYTLEGLIDCPLYPSGKVKAYAALQ